MAPIRILIVDDHEVVRRGLELVLRLESDLMLVGEAADGGQAIEQARTLQPTLVLLDLKMPGMSGILAARAIKRAAPATRILILTGLDTEQDIVAALESGVEGYILKDAPAHELIHAIRVIAAGQAYLQPIVTKRLLRRMALPNLPATPVPPPLTPRELDVLRLMATSRSNKEIADVLVIAEDTVRSHSKSILHKLGQSSRTQAVLTALRLKLIDLD
ncbi:MAG: response regulator transcription factor [Herpetosiphon sp.]